MQLFRFAFLSLAAAALSFAADIDGKWTGELTGKITNKAKITGAEMKVTITVEGRDFVMEYTAKKSS